MIVGNDISNFQGNVDFQTYKNNTNFLICKASEGTGYIDGWFGNNRTQARNNGIPLGFYHFGRPDVGNSAQAEAKFFCDLVDGDPIREGEILVLDFEVTYNDPVNWCKAWLDAVSQHFGGMKPMIYMDQSRSQGFDWTPVVSAGYGLWIAAYTYNPNNNEAATGAWPFAAMQQWTDKQEVPGIQGVIDGDVFFGTVDQFKAYGFKKPTPPPAPQPPVVTPPVEVPPVVTPPVTLPPVVPNPPTPPITPVPQPKPVHEMTAWEMFFEFLKKLFNLR